MNKNNSKEIGRFRFVLMSTAILTYLTIVFGGIQRIALESYACPTWLNCYSTWFPILKTLSLSSFLHLIANTLTGPSIYIASFFAYIHYKNIKWIYRPMIIASFLLSIQIMLGAYLASSGSFQYSRIIHYALALLILGAVTTATVMAYVLKFDPNQKDRLLFQSQFSKMAKWVLIFIFIILFSGSVLSNSDVNFSCSYWPLCDWNTLSFDSLAWLNIFHRLAVGVGVVLMLRLLIQAWRSQRTQRAILTAVTTTVVLYFSQAFVGALLSLREFKTYLLVLHEATSAAVFASAIILFMFVGLAARTAEEEDTEISIAINHKQRAKDLLALTKPIVVLLLLFTTYAGMVIGAKSLPSLELSFWTMLGGALAAGGSGAVNQYIDRNIDQKMTRTAKRPIPSGRMTAAEGLAFGVALLFISFYIMAGFVNLLAAMLSLAGMIYYVLLYSIILKTTTVQNIVIGGGAGAIPPLVGWAATTGGLSFGAWYLFLIVFMWTPPHFWALALVRTKDYAKAGIPMLPVVRGEKVTRLQIFVYTILLVIITIMMFFFGLAGKIYLVFTSLLGLWLIYIAWGVWKKGGNKIAWKMYRYSSMYLAFLFIVMMVDSLI